MQTPNEIEIVRNKISSLFQDPLCKILMEQSFFTQIQLEALLIDYLTYQATEVNITQQLKAQSRQLAKGKSRGSYNRVLRQARKKLDKTLHSMLLLGYLGTLGDTRIQSFVDTSQKMQEYIGMRQYRLLESKKEPVSPDTKKEKLETEAELRKHLYQLITGRNT
jgi:hypothetical protein